MHPIGNGDDSVRGKSRFSWGIAARIWRLAPAPKQLEHDLKRTSADPLSPDLNRRKIPPIMFRPWDGSSKGLC